MVSSDVVSLGQQNFILELDSSSEWDAEYKLVCHTLCEVNQMNNCDVSSFEYGVPYYSVHACKYYREYVELTTCTLEGGVLSCLHGNGIRCTVNII